MYSYLQGNKRKGREIKNNKASVKKYGARNWSPSSGKALDGKFYSVSITRQSVLGNQCLVIQCLLGRAAWITVWKPERDAAISWRFGLASTRFLVCGLMLPCSAELTPNQRWATKLNSWTSRVAYLKQFTWQYRVDTIKLINEICNTMIMDAIWKRPRRTEYASTIYLVYTKQIERLPGRLFLKT